MNVKNIRNVRTSIQEREHNAICDMLTCIRCGKYYSKQMFIKGRLKHTKSGIEFRYAKECCLCRQRALDSDTRKCRNRIDTRTYASRNKDYQFVINRKIHQYKYHDFKKNRQDDVTREEYDMLLPKDYIARIMSQPCTYCGTEPTEDIPNGLDRIDNSTCHKILNVVPCCETCNIMKQTLGISDFLEHIHKIAKHSKSNPSLQCFTE